MNGTAMDSASLRQRDSGRAAKAAQAQALRAEGLTWREVGERMGIALKTAHDYANDPTGDKARERRRRRHGQCCDCGSPTYNGGSLDVPERCRDCADPGAIARERAAVAAEQMLALRFRGLTNRQIAADLGVHVTSVARSLKRLRDEGRDVPLSPHYVAARNGQAPASGASS